MKEIEFIDELMCHILEGVNIPKVQVERAINPILSLFVESILNKYFENIDGYSGEYQLISPEFPLKKDNNQSTNIDYLLVNNSKKVLVFFELKTDAGSLGMKQLNRYLAFKDKIAESSIELLRKDLEEIKKKSPKRSKYNNVISKFDLIIGENNIYNLIIIYLVPFSKVIEIKGKKGIDFVLSFSELPEIIDHKFGEFWTIIRNNLVQLDNNSLKKQQKGLSGNEVMNLIVNNIRIFSQNTALNPVYFQIGILGGGNTPNYQVKFSNGQIKTFRFNGNPHHFPVFKNSNLSKAIYWKDID